MKEKAEFYQNHLDHVSRSFAFCIRQLPQPLRNWVALSYLLCRLVDTVEDADWADLDSQLAAFKIFDLALTQSESVENLRGWESSFPAGVTDGERKLLNDAAILLADFHQLPGTVHEIIRELVLSMSLGMQHFCRQRAGGNLRLSSLAEVNQYCFFVAGLVGELLAKLVALVEPRFGLSRLCLLRAHHFGLFLQKVNLLKDQVEDENMGRHLIPSRDLVERSSQENASEALNFVLAVPHEQKEFRRFCAWSLFLGMESLKVARESVTKKQVLKVPRRRTEEVLLQVEQSLDDDRILQSLFETFAQKLGWMKREVVGAQAENFPAWLMSLYRGPLDTRSLTALGLA